MAHSTKVNKIKCIQGLLRALPWADWLIAGGVDWREQEDVNIREVMRRLCRDTVDKIEKDLERELVLAYALCDRCGQRIPLQDRLFCDAYGCKDEDKADAA